jgi:exonuclease SbcC
MYIIQKKYIAADAETNEARQKYDTQEKLFLDAQAGILARDLREGCECPVCGSTHHPKPASPAGHVPQEQEIKHFKEIYEEKSKMRSELSSQSGIAKGKADTAFKQMLAEFTALFGEDLKAADMIEATKYVMKKTDEYAQTADEEQKKIQKEQVQLENDCKSYMKLEKMLSDTAVLIKQEEEKDINIRRNISRYQAELDSMSTALKKLQEQLDFSEKKQAEDKIETDRKKHAELECELNTVTRG